MTLTPEQERQWQAERDALSAKYQAEWATLNAKWQPEWDALNAKWDAIEKANPPLKKCPTCGHVEGTDYPCRICGLPEEAHLHQRLGLIGRLSLVIQGPDFFGDGVLIGRCGRYTKFERYAAAHIEGFRP
jgi:hypothetical protein